MRHEIIEMKDAQIIGIAKEIAFNQGGEDCPKFWGEYYETLVKPVVVEDCTPNDIQQAAMDNGVGEFALCTCDIPNHNCAMCATDNFTSCNTRMFTYVIGGIYRGGAVPQGMKLFSLPSGRWLKIYFEGGMKAYGQQHEHCFKEWLPQHPEFRIALNSVCLEWYQGMDMESPDYQCGVMLPLV